MQGKKDDKEQERVGERERTDEQDQVKEQEVTYEIYAAMPDDGKRYEIIDGSLMLMSPGPSTNHQFVSGELEFLLRQSCKSEYVIFDAPLDVILSKVDVFQPDLVMIHRSRMQIVTSRGIEGPPDLAVEIVSPGSRSRDKVIKMKSYAKYGVEEYWVVDTESRTLEQYRLLDSPIYELHAVFERDDPVASDKLPCVSFTVSDIFKELGSFG
ncbi:Uma2 family endonuclease [Paenibacillus koleovorans]|uniref:Uma2 family endonuclease n=1 Tax=Paenibacillus koleovorans TaxID=121608 RepID=UPI000FD8519F|nr:Uma2 family endonuclease [Paenibacillus koleovorans]